MKVLITGGNGNISWHCVNNAILAGMDVTVVKRSQGSLLRRKLPNNVKIINTLLHIGFISVSPKKGISTIKKKKGIATFEEKKGIATF